MKTNELHVPKSVLLDMKEKIRRLTEAGFDWNPQQKGNNTSIDFNDYFNDLLAFKKKHGNCKVYKYRSEEYASLRNWCRALTHAKNEKPDIELSEEEVRRLNEIGFKTKRRFTFDERFNDLLKFKKKYGNCRPKRSIGYNDEFRSLSNWCADVRKSKRQMENNQKVHVKLSEEMIRRLTDIGFEWCIRPSRVRIGV